MSRSTIPAILIAAVMLLAGGWVLALIVDPAAILGITRPGADDGVGQDAHDDEHEGIVGLGTEAYRNLKLGMRKVTLSSGKHTIQVPGEIVEKPGQSDHALAAPVHGVVTEIYALPGQAIRPGDPLFKLHVIDEALTTAQLNLLNTIARLDRVDSELQRVGPLADAGTVLGRKKLELEYEQKELKLKQRLYEQELAVRGLSEEQVAAIKTDQNLIRELIVRMPNDAGHGSPADVESAAPADPLRPVSDTTTEHDWEYTLEDLKVFPGKSVARGDDLCHVAYHTKLYVQGHIFESELDYVLELGEGDKEDWTVTAIFGSDDAAEEVDGLRVHYVDNHVDSESQTYSFYVPLSNRVVRDATDDEGRRFRTWQYKPGQRVHLKLPTSAYTNMIVLPRTAVATEGANYYVFREFVHEAADDGSAHGHGHGDQKIVIELERVPVIVAYQDSDYVHVAPDGELRPGDRVATKNAYRLYLEQKSQSGGGDAGHGHEH